MTKVLNVREPVEIMVPPFLIKALDGKVGAFRLLIEGKEAQVQLLVEISKPVMVGSSAKPDTYQGTLNVQIV